MSSEREAGMAAATSALRAYGAWHGGLDEDSETVAQDLVSDLLHVVAAGGGDCERLIRCAVMNYEGERDGDAFAV